MRYYLLYYYTAHARHGLAHEHPARRTAVCLGPAEHVLRPPARSAGMQCIISASGELMAQALMHASKGLQVASRLLHAARSPIQVSYPRHLSRRPAVLHFFLLAVLFQCSCGHASLVVIVLRASSYTRSPSTTFQAPISPPRSLIAGFLLLRLRPTDRPPAVDHAYAYAYAPDAIARNTVLLRRMSSLSLLRLLPSLSLPRHGNTS